jgi:hypothetical protein
VPRRDFLRHGFFVEARLEAWIRDLGAGRRSRSMSMSMSMSMVAVQRSGSFAKELLRLLLRSRSRRAASFVWRDVSRYFR